jgi:hypothetical protein
METATAIVIGAALISGAVIWSENRSSIEAARAAQCAGYMASPMGGEAVFRLSAHSIESKRTLATLKPRTAEEEDTFAAALEAEMKRRGLPLPGNSLLSGSSAPAVGETEDAFNARFLATVQQHAREAEVFSAGLLFAGCKLIYPSGS